MEFTVLLAYQYLSISLIQMLLDEYGLDPVNIYPWFIVQFFFVV